MSDAREKARTTAETKEQRDIFSTNLTKLVGGSEKSQAEIAKSIGVSPQTFNSWVRANALPKMGKLQKIADYFGVNETDLIMREAITFVDDAKAKRLAREIVGQKDLEDLFTAAKGANADDIKLATDMLNRMKNRS